MALLHDASDSVLESMLMSELICQSSAPSCKGGNSGALSLRSSFAAPFAIRVLALYFAFLVEKQMMQIERCMMCVLPAKHCSPVHCEGAHTAHQLTARSLCLLSAPLTIVTAH
jgi:hypothetical protein